MSPLPPYKEIVASVPQLFRKLNTPKLETLTIHFNLAMWKRGNFLSDIQYLDTRLFMLAVEFPLLSRVRFDIGCDPHEHSFWLSLFSRYFPLLVGRGFLELIKHNVLQVE
ncbi:hypothetical protein PYCCODRAFT_402309 [Trametes coccinea BRFM310]|uniref:Uncharacterized protein n=1 Tax=Trametes coccinea (strain BRFM310) TaxID=1353009 RepID=A0A1Y2IMU2_TRAC3|nr:hypothetical protein PYCCODRAFT_402309 [Trametes coccinea BRFM310]